MALDQPTYSGEVEYSLANGTLTSSCCTGAALAIDGNISTSATFTPPTLAEQGNGLNAVYYQDGPGNPQNSFGLTMYTTVEQTVDHETYGSIPSFLNSGYGNFDVHWDGWIVPGYSETYTFTLDPGTWDDYIEGSEGDGAGGIDLNGQSLCFLSSGLDSHDPISGSIALSAGVPYVLHVGRSDSPSNYYVRLLWQSASQAPEVVPESALYSTEPTLAGRYLRVDFDEAIAVARVRLGVSGDGAANAAVLLITPGGSMIPVAYGADDTDGIVQDSPVSLPVYATGVIFQADYSLNTTGLGVSDYPDVTVNQLQVYRAVPEGVFGNGCSCDWSIAATFEGTEYEKEAASTTSYESAARSTSEWIKTSS